ncbi:MAG: beta-propeller fold lactonase family protein, partial [Acidobacteriia bacterium]|nr:beta-propeller fold lactonase family protein [Terriglobia bacterium]
MRPTDLFRNLTSTPQSKKHKSVGQLWLAAVLLLALALALPLGAQAQGNYLYVNNQTAQNSVNAYSVSATGALSELPGSPFSTGGPGANVVCYGLNRITVSGANNLLFVANTGNQSISAFQINPATGTLTLTAGSPFASGLTLDTCQGMSIATTPDGLFLMASSNGQINTFSIAANGALALISATPNCCAPMASMVISPNGKFLAASNETNVSVFTINAGVLTPVAGSPFPKTGTGLVAGLDFSCAADRLYGGEATGSPTITDAWTVDANGVLAPVPGTPFHTVGNDSNIVLLSPDNSVLFESNQFTNSVNSFNVNADGSLVNIGKFGGTTAVHVPVGMATDAGGRFLYVADDSFGVAVFRINAGGSLTSLSDLGINRPGELQDLAAYPPRSCATADLTITKSASPTVVAGSPIVYTVTITNNSLTAASAVISDTLPAGTTSGGNLKIVAATGAQRASGVVTIHTTAPHQMFAGEKVVVTGVGDPSFNGTFNVASVVDTFTFTYSQAGVDLTSGSGTATTPNCQVPAGGTGVCGTPIVARLIPIVASTGAKRVGGVVTITTTAPHVLLAGQTVSVSGVSNTSFNGTFPIVSVPTPTTITYNQAGVNATAGGGNVVTGQTLTAAFNSLGSGETQTVLLTTTTSSTAANGTVISNAATISNKSAVDPNPADNTATAVVTVGTPVATTITVPNGTGPYGGLATLTAVLKNSVTNVPIAGKTLTFQLNGNLASAVTDATGTATATSLPIGTISVGTHASAFTVSFGGDSSFLASSAVGTLVVTKAQLTVAADNQSRLYGDPNPALTYTITGFVNGDTIAVVSGTANCTTTATPTSPVGTYPITCTVGTLTATNYVFVFVPGTLTVNPAPLTVTVANAVRAYGDPNPVFTGTITGLKNGDDITATYSTTATQTSPAGTYPITATLVDPGNVLGNYAVTNTPGTLTVTPAAIVVTANNAARLYGDPNPVFTGTIAGIKNGDNITAIYTTPATPASPIGTYPIIPTLTDNGTGALANYTITANNGSLTVSPAPLTVTAANATRAFGAPDPVFTGTIVGIKNGDNITATYSTTATAASPAGTYPIIPTLVDPALKLGNYTVTSVNGTLTITAAVLTVTANNASRLYGDPNPVFTGIITGIVNGDNITATYASVADPTSPIGTYAIVPTVSDNGTGALAHYIVIINNGILTVNPAPLTMTAANVSRAYGDPNPVFTGLIVGIKNGDNITATFASTADPTSAVGTYPIVPTLIDPTLKLGNYTVTSINGTLTVTAAPLTVTADNASRLFSTPNPPLSGTITG